MTISDTLKSSFPKSISREDEIFTSLITNENGTACLEKQLKDASNYMKSISNAGDIYTSDIEVTKKAIEFLTYFEMFTNEQDESFKDRIKAVFYRNGDETWGTPYDIKHVFEGYFKHADIYVVENTGLLSDGAGNENLLLDYDFTDEDAWETDCEYSRDARFTGSQGIKTITGSYCKQSVYVDADMAYMLHFFHSGNITVEIKNNEDKYWDSTEFYDSENDVYRLGKWVSEEKSITFSSSEWKDGNVAFITDDNTESVEINFVGIGDCFLDYVRLFKKHEEPTFTLIAHFTGESISGALSLARGTSDPVEGTTDPSDVFYENAGYYNGTFLTGVSTGFANDIYHDLLDYLRPSGVKAYLEIVMKDI